MIIFFFVIVEIHGNYNNLDDPQDFPLKKLRIFFLVENVFLCLKIFDNLHCK